MRRRSWRFCIGLLLAFGCRAQSAGGRVALNWQETQDRFRANNPTLSAGREGIQEAHAEEITAYLRPNPGVTFGWDQLTPFNANPYRPIAQSYAFWSLDYLHEREHKRELRLASAKLATKIEASSQSDLERNLLFNLRDAFVRVLLAKAVLRVGTETLDFYDKQIAINRDRLSAGAIAKVDFERVEIQRAQFEADVQTARVNLRTAKIDLLALLHEPTAPDDFDVREEFEYREPAASLEELRRAAIAERPDLREAQQALEKARTDHQLSIANGASDPTFAVDVSHQPAPLNTYVGLSVTFPLRVFDRNQGEKLRTAFDIGRNEKLQEATETSVFHDVDAAYATLENTLVLLRPYKSKYLQEADEIRATISFAFEHGAGSLLDFIDAQREYRNTQLTYLNLVGAYFSAANQVNFSVGREVIR